ncbi:M28 family peptidase [Nonomuraea typhae]|uniref:M28 family peptidase n=1 Tax=Nonomuraea typhae TaxID=2603600 RepID=A0ABW7ZBQ7_9ACTN
MRRRLSAGVLGAAALALVTPLALSAPAYADHGRDPARKLVQDVKGRHVERHLKVLDLIAKVNGGTRVSSTQGYNLSRDYVATLLRAAGYKVTVQPFEFTFDGYRTKPVLERVSPSPKPYKNGFFNDYVAMGDSPAGSASGTLQAVDLVLPPTPAPSSTSGCEPADFAGFTRGNVALMQRGTCNFAIKAKNAQDAGASAVIVFNEGQPGRTDVDLNPTLSDPSITIPSFFTSFATGSELAATPGTTVKLNWDPIVEQRTTYNVIAESRGGRADNVVMMGAHLDSVQEGPGINDNGSGTAGVLEVALQMAKYRPVNKVRFGFWGAEEFGLLGSKHYVASLSQEERNDIGLYLNYDMIGSPNFVYQVYDGDGDAFGVPGPEGSAQLEKDYQSFYGSRGLPYKPSEFDGRSDYKAFIDAGIAGGGLFTGAEKRKTEEEAKLFGGTAGIPYDPCYHGECDTIKNISKTALDVNADAIATLAAKYTYDKAALDAIHKPGAPHTPPAAARMAAEVAHDDVPSAGS